MTTADLDFDALEKTAKAATPGPWSADADAFGHNDDGWSEAMAIAATVGRQKIYARAGSNYPSNDQRYIAAANPETFLALIALARRTMAAEDHCEGWRMTAATGEGTIARLTAERNTLRTERDALRDAVIHLGTLQLQRDRDAHEAWAIRQTANDLSAPFSDERVQARLAEYLAKEPTS